MFKRITGKTPEVLLLSLIMTAAMAFSSFAGSIFSQALGFTKAGFDAQVKYNNLDESPVLNGGEVRFLKNNTDDVQQLSVVMKSSDGKVIVIDGGWKDDAEHLLSVIREFGGTVDAWLITHPQADHVGAIITILREHKDEINIKNFYYNFYDKMWYRKVDEKEIGSVSQLIDEFEKLPEEVKHSSMVRDDVVTLSDNLSFRVMNSPVPTRDRYAVNASGLMYDITIDSKHFIILGDMAAQVGDVLVSWGVLDGVVCDYVQLAHHGQEGVSRSFYEKLAPKNAIWPTPKWLFESTEESGYETYATKVWMQELKVNNNYAATEHDVVIR